ncbi:hypothetical protein F442_00025 [Phytophthora nicotianae P10297]|uniref:Uncharacterized protein n=1 Tax=Phytophthora nicotianae P10297 TaxID=1317064 RepID=W3A8C2_PHYNI|nr:hypothetical protein F442_00025 [Phytophthora nicotianae P10297]
MSIDKSAKHQITRQYVREKNRLEKVMPTSSRKLLRTVDPKERPCIATPQNSAHTTPVCTTPVCATPARATPPRTTQATFSRTTPARPTPSRTTPAQTTPACTCSTSTNPQTSLEQDPARESRSLPGQHEHDQLQSPRLARALFSGQQNGSTGGMDRRERDTPSCQTPAPTAPASQTDLDDTAVGILTLNSIRLLLATDN